MTGSFGDGLRDTLPTLSSGIYSIVIIHDQDPLQSSWSGYSALTRATRARVPVAEFVCSTLGMLAQGTRQGKSGVKGGGVPPHVAYIGPFALLENSKIRYSLAG